MVFIRFLMMRVKDKEVGAGRILELKIVDDSKPPADKM